MKKLKRSTYLKLRFKAVKLLAKLQNWLFNAAVASVILAAVLLIWRVANPPVRVQIPPQTVAAMQIAPGSLTELYAISLEEGLSFPWLVTLYSTENNFKSGNTQPARYGTEFNRLKRRYHRGDIAKYYEMFSGIFAEIEQFPIPPMYRDNYIYSDTGLRRTFILDRENVRGRTPVVSMTDGRILQAGWSVSRGYYALIISGYGGRYSYSHLDNLEERIRPGEQIEAGQILGTMGAVENSPVGLMLGISPMTAFAEDFWLNPYSLLRFYENFLRTHE